MPNYHLEVSNISRGKCNSLARSANYISGKQIRDIYNGKTYYHSRMDVLNWGIALPSDAPEEFYNLQVLVDRMNEAETRCDARTGRKFICSLPNELYPEEQIDIVKEFIQDNFVHKGLCAIWAIHKGENKKDHFKNNPHVHIIVSTRQVEPSGFSKLKFREYDKKSCLTQWRKNWAEIQNRAYERSGLNVRVTHKRLKDRGITERDPLPYLSQKEWQKYKRDELTPKIYKRKLQEIAKEEHTRQRNLEKKLIREITRSR